MGECDLVGCEGDDKISYTCNECGLTFCSDHRLPESHNCSALRKSGSEADGVFATGLQNKDGKKRGLTERSNRVVRDDSGGESETNQTQSSDEASDDSEGSNLRDHIPGKDPTGERPSKSRNTKDKTNLRQYQAKNKSKCSPTPKTLAERSSNTPPDTGFTFRWATWLYRLIVVLIVALLISVLLVGFTPASVPSGVPSEIADPIERAGGISSAFVANITDELNSSDSAADFEQSTTSEDLTEKSSGLNSEEIEQLVHEKVNEEREPRGLSTLSFDTNLAEIARYHSKDMAQNNYFAHTSPDGEELGDRYEMFGYDCQADMGGNQYATGGENIFKQSFTGFTFTNEELANETVEGWMNSPGHRENMLQEYWDNEGIGVYIMEDGSETTVYITQNFC
jgi:uncharacterized protein YkwD